MWSLTNRMKTQGPGARSHSPTAPGRPGRSLDGILGTKGNQWQFLSSTCLVHVEVCMTAVARGRGWGPGDGCGYGDKQRRAYSGHGLEVVTAGRAEGPERGREEAPELPTAGLSAGLRPFLPGCNQRSTTRKNFTLPTLGRRSATQPPQPERHTEGPSARNSGLTWATPLPKRLVWLLWPETHSMPSGTFGQSDPAEIRSPSEGRRHFNSNSGTGLMGGSGSEQSRGRFDPHPYVMQEGPRWGRGYFS